jgi:hypothetical protein
VGVEVADDVATVLSTAPLDTRLGVGLQGSFVAGSHD